MPSLGLDVVWVLTCAALVFVMQAGFGCLEAGVVRSRNSINVAAKNAADFCVCTIVFWMVGYAFMWGDSADGVIGVTHFFLSSEIDASEAAFFLFQLVFCGAATTIISGAVAERTSFRGFLVIAVMVSLLIYPVFGHWAWYAGNGAEGAIGWLKALGFVDFAGSTVVHAVAGWVALAALIVIGPRSGRFDGSGTKFRPHSMPLAVLGLFLIWFGWIGFNGGSTLGADIRVPGVIMNTMLAGSFGGATAILFTMTQVGKVSVLTFVNGTLAGLVAVTAGAHAVVAWEAALIGIVGSLVAFHACHLLTIFKIDDVVGAVAVHGAAGIWGTLAVAVFGDLEQLGTGLTRIEQLGVQLLGVGVAGAWAFSVSYVVLRIVKQVMVLRVPLAVERLGLNISEHGESTDKIDLLLSMEHQRQTLDFNQPISVEPNSEVGDIAAQYNLVLSRLNSAKADAERANDAKSRFLASVSHELRTPLNAIIGFSEMMQQEFFGDLGNDKYKEYVGAIHSSSKHLLTLVDDILNVSVIQAGERTLDIEDVHLPSLLRESARVASHSVKNKQLQLRVIGDEAMPVLRADARAIRQIVLNLLSNAIKFTPDNGEVMLSCGSTGNAFTIEVRDTGVGVSKDMIAKITEPFVSVGDDAYVAQGGTGLGLAIVKSLIGLHEGTLEIDSAIGVGTTVTVTIPQYEEKAEAAE